MVKKYTARPLVSFDWAIKKLLRNKADFGILEGFLSVLFEQKVVVEEILESESNRNHDDDKQIVVDLLCSTSNKELVCIEIQFNHQIDYFQRMLYISSKTISERLMIGHKYEKVKKLYLVNLVYFDLGQGEDYAYRSRLEFKGINQKDVLGNSQGQIKKFKHEDPGGIFPEYYLLKVKRFDNQIRTLLDEWLYYFKNEALPEGGYKAEGLSLVAEQLKVEKMDVKELKAYQKYKDQIVLSDSVYESAYTEGHVEGIEKGIEQGIEKGIEMGKAEGKLEGKIETVLNGYKKGHSIKLISDIVDLPEERIKEILEENGLM